MKKPILMDVGSGTGDDDTLGGTLAHRSACTPGTSVVFSGGQTAITLAKLDTVATRCAHALLAGGVHPGDLVGLLTPACPRFLVNLFGVMRAGAAACLLPVPISGACDEAQLRRIGRIVATSGMHHLLVDPAFTSAGAELARAHAGLRVHLSTLEASGTGALPRVGPRDLAIVQFTSGSTGNPRGVMLSHHAVLRGLRAINTSAGLRPGDVLVQWVPLYHDMGLFGLLSQLLNGSDVHVVDAFAFIRRPGQFLRYAAQVGATIISGPDFSYDLMLSALSVADIATLDLSRLRVAFNGAEPVRSTTVERFARELAPAGVTESVMYPVYGMAEVTLAITFPRPGTPPHVVHVDRRWLTEHREARLAAACAASVKPLVSVGRPVAGIELRIVDTGGVAGRGSSGGAPTGGTVCGPGRIGEIQVRGDAVTHGYYRDPAATTAAFDGEWLRTGDLGFRLGDDLFIAGRRKEMVIVHGRNYFPEDAEAAVRDLPGVYKGRCVAVAQTAPDGGECIVLIVETAVPAAAREALAGAVRERIAAELDLAAVQVHLVAPRWLTRTTSGKWQRLWAAQRLGTDHPAVAR